MKTAVWSGVLATGLLVGIAGAQVEVGAKAPVPEIKSFANAKFKSMRDLKGHLVIYEYFAHW